MRVMILKMMVKVLEPLEMDAFRIIIRVAILIAWYNPRIPGLPLNRYEKEQVVFSEDAPRVPKMSLALEQPQTCTGATLGLL